MKEILIYKGNYSHFFFKEITNVRLFGSCAFNLKLVLCSKAEHRTNL
jgi:hypothetical protein